MTLVAQRIVAGSFVVVSSQGRAQAEVTAQLQVARTAHVARYEVVASGFDDPSHYGAGAVHSAFTPDAPGDWVEGDSFYCLSLSSWRGPGDEMEKAACWMKRRFAGIRVQVRIRFKNGG